MQALHHEDIHKAVGAAKAEAQRRGLPFTIAIVDAGRNLAGFLRLPGAPLGTIEAAHGKAYAASSLGMRTSEIDPLVQPGAPLFGMAQAHHSPFITFGGGVPFHRDGVMCGAVGVSGGALEDDIAIAEAAASVLGDGA